MKLNDCATVFPSSLAALLCFEEVIQSGSLVCTCGCGVIQRDKLDEKSLCRVRPAQTRQRSVDLRSFGAVATPFTVHPNFTFGQLGAFEPAMNKRLTCHSSDPASLLTTSTSLRHHVQGSFGESGQAE